MRVVILDLSKMEEEIDAVTQVVISGHTEITHLKSAQFLTAPSNHYLNIHVN